MTRQGIIGIVCALFAMMALTGRAGAQTSDTPTPPTDAASPYAQGMDLLAQGKVIEARGMLSAALLGGKLSKAQESRALKALNQLARDTIFSPKVYQGDPIAMSYTMKSGDTFSSVSRRLGLNVPASLLEQVNRLDGQAIGQGTTIKLLRGPFLARIDKHTFTMDVYLRAPDGQQVFVRRAKVALGRNDSTPVGMFRVAGKAKHATWVPPKSMSKKYKKPVQYGQKGYPLGKEGYFMSLRGIDSSTRSVKGYGIHGTNDQSSIGKARSHGCIRMAEADVGPVWSLMTEGTSTVQIVP